jgi:hypothetical protein
MPQQMARLVDTHHKMARLSIVPSAVVQLSCPSPCGATPTAVHVSAPLVAPVRLVRLLYKSQHMN